MVHNGYLLIINDHENPTLIMQASLPGANSIGIDVYENGKRLADYTYNTIDECLSDLSRLTWLFLKPKKMNRSQIIKYTENWLVKSYIFSGSISNHPEYNYINTPKLIRFSKFDAVFRAVEVTLLKIMGPLEKAIEEVNELNTDRKIDARLITKKDILSGKIIACKELFDEICLQMDTFMDVIDQVPGKKINYDLKNTKFREAYIRTASSLYEKLTGCICPTFFKEEARWKKYM